MDRETFCQVEVTMTRWMVTLLVALDGHAARRAGWSHCSSRWMVTLLVALGGLVTLVNCFVG